MSEPFQLSISIGPVQAFVAQARRTRDLWAGSWLLSYLAESALVATEHRGAIAVIPHRPAPGTRTSTSSSIGGIPNRFEVRLASDITDQEVAQVAQAAREAFDTSWERIARTVWDRFVAPYAENGDHTAEIWSRQVDHFWEFNWVAGVPDPKSGTVAYLAAARKSFRNVPVAEEAGTKCSLMPAFQEISGHHGGGSWRAQREFWESIRKHVGQLDLKPSERLCSVAMIKRHFPRVMTAAIGEEIAEELRIASRPSTAFIAASPWLSRLEGEAKDLADNHAKEAQRIAAYQPSEHQAAVTIGIPWAAVDGPVWFESAVRNDFLNEANDLLQPGERRRISERLAASLKETRTKAGSSPVPYYAVLLMDGDSLGRLLEELQDPQDLSRRLGDFSRSVDPLVREGLGETVYAGGDDVMAIVPAESAIRVAERLRDAYLEAFADGPAAKVATISASVTFAHWRHPLREIIRTGHVLLDDIAKDRTGRDAIAVGVVRRSGLNTVWSVPWSVFRGEASQPDQSRRPFLEMLDWFGSDHNSGIEHDRPTFNPSYLYTLRDRFTRLVDRTEELPGTYSGMTSDATPAPTLLRDLAHAELRRRMSGQARKTHSRHETEVMVNQLMALSQPWTRIPGTGAERRPTIRTDPNAFGFDGWRVARFLQEVRDGKVTEHD